MKRVFLTIALALPIGHFLDTMGYIAYGQNKPILIIIISIVCGFGLGWIGYIAAGKILKAIKSDTSDKSKVLNIADVSTFYFKKIVEILVDEGLSDDVRIKINLDFAMKLKVGDVLFFEENYKNKPKWIIDTDEKYHLLDGGSIILTQRNILYNEIQFYAKYG